jgi:hypothetical protein
MAQHVLRPSNRFLQTNHVTMLCRFLLAAAVSKMPPPKGQR